MAQGWDVSGRAAVCAYGADSSLAELQRVLNIVQVFFHS